MVTRPSYTRRLILLAGLAGVLAWTPAFARAPEPIAVQYFIPAEAPTGEVQVMSFGLAELPVGGPLGRRRFLHLRLAAFNGRDVIPWRLDARDQALVLPSGERIPPAFAETTPETVPAALTLPFGARGYVDLFFPVFGELGPPWTSLAWVVRRHRMVTAGTTTFQRLQTSDSDYAYYGPSRHRGGHLLIGGTWCSPRRWHSSWRHRYARYGEYGHRRDRDGVQVHGGGSVWHGDQVRGHGGGQETVGIHWRRAMPERTVVASPAPAGWSVASPDRGPVSHAEPVSVGRSWRQAEPPPLPAETSSSRGDDSPAPAPPPRDEPSRESVGSHWRERR